MSPQCNLNTRRGVEHVSNSSRIKESEDSGGAECGADFSDSPPSDPDLAVVIDAWAKLPEAVRAGILAMIRAVKWGR